MSNKNKKNGKTERTTETITSADVATVDASELTGETAPESMAATPEQLYAETPKTATGPVTLTQKNVHRNGYVVYGVDGMRGSVFLSKSLFVGEPAQYITLSDIPNLVYIDEALATKKREQRAKREERKKNAEANREARKAKIEARAAKLQAQLDKLKAQEEKRKAKDAGKDSVEGETASEGNTPADVEQPFTEAAETV